MKKYFLLSGKIYGANKRAFLLLDKFLEVRYNEN